MKKKNKKIIPTPLPEPEKILYIDYTTSSRGGESMSDEPYSDRTPEYREVHFRCLVRKQASHKMFYDSVEVDEKTYNSNIGYLAVVYYSDGDTFGTTHGYHYIVGCYSSYNEASDKLTETIEGSGHKPWECFFASLERSEVHPLPIS